MWQSGFTKKNRAEETMFPQPCSSGFTLSMLLFCLRCAHDLHLEVRMATQAVNLGFRVPLVADRAGNVAQMRLVGIAVLEILRFRFLCQFVQGTVTGQATAVLHRIIGLWNILAVALGAGDPRPGMKIVRVIGAGPGAENLLHHGHIVFARRPPGAFVPDQPEILPRRPGMTGRAIQ